MGSATGPAGRPSWAACGGGVGWGVGRQPDDIMINTNR